MKTLKLISAAILLATMQAVGATEYYVCDTGSDSNDGLSPDTPIATASKAISIFNAISAGDSVLFCRGGKFTVANDLRIYNPNCQASKPCTLADYQPPSGQLPNLPVLTQTGGTNLFNFQDSGNADHDEGYVVKNLMLTGLTSGNAMYFYNDVDDVTIDSVVFNTFSKGAYETGSNPPNPGSNALNERITLNNVGFVNVTQKIATKSGNVKLASTSAVDGVTTSAPTGAAVTYYVCNNGNDTNTGLSMDAPWQTFEKAMSVFNSMKAGNAIAFCQGGVFQLTKNPPNLYNPSCTAANPCRIEDYVPVSAKSNAKPVIKSNFQGVFNFQDKLTPDRDGGYIVKNLQLTGTGIGNGIFLYNDVDDVTISNMKINGFEIGVYSSGSSGSNPELNGQNDRLIIKNSLITNNSHQGFLGACNNCVIEGNVFENNGFAKKILNHNIYFSGDNSKNITIKNNKLYKSAIVDGQCYGVSLVVHGIVNGLTIDSNEVFEDVNAASPYCWGISVDPGWSAKEEKFTNITISNNKVTNHSNIAIGCASCGNAVISRNTIASSQPGGFVGIQVPVRKEDTYKSNNVNISQNNISVLNSSKIVGIHIPNVITNLSVQSNIINYKSSESLCTSPSSYGLTGGNTCNKTN